MKKRESYKKHLNRGVMAVSFAVIFIVFSIMGGRIQAFADDAVATQTDAAKSNSSGPVTTGLAIDGYYGEWSQYPSADITYKLDSILPASDGTVNVDSSTLALLQFYTNNPNSVEHMFGSEVAKRARMLNSLFTLHNGDMSLTLQDFATYNSADPDVKNGHAEQVRKLIATTGYTAEGVLHLLFLCLLRQTLL